MEEFIELLRDLGAKVNKCGKINEYINCVCNNRSRSLFNLKPVSVIVYQFQTVRFIQMMSLTFGLFTQVGVVGWCDGSG